MLGSSLLGKALKKGIVEVNLVQIRDFSKNIHRTVDDKPFGGGEGMLLRVDVLYDAWKSIVGERAAQARAASVAGRVSKKKVCTIMLSPQGTLLDQAKARELAELDEIILICGHYEGVDQRFIELCVDEQLSVGDYVLTGGEIAALAVIDVVTRILPGTVGNPRSITEDSLEGGQLKHPQYTRPREFMGHQVPEVLLSGDHKKIDEWKRNRRSAKPKAKAKPRKSRS